MTTTENFQITCFFQSGNPIQPRDNPPWFGPKISSPLQEVPETNNTGH